MMTEIRETIMFCVKLDAPDKSGAIYCNFYPTAGTIRIFWPNATIARVRVREALEGEVPDQCGWWNLETPFGPKKPPRFTMVYRNKMVLQICFPYGIDSAEGRKQGLALPVMIEELPDE